MERWKLSPISSFKYNKQNNKATLKFVLQLCKEEIDIILKD